MVPRWAGGGVLTWQLDGFLVGVSFLLLGMAGVGDPRGRAALPEMLLQAFDGAIQLAGADLVVDVHEI